MSQSLEEQKRKQKAKRLYNTYGITIEQWEAMLCAQNGTCWICKSLPESGILCVDHQHIKGYKKMSSEDKAHYVRDLLCFKCNTGLKGFEKTKNGKENRQRLEGTYLYFQKHKLKGE